MNTVNTAWTARRELDIFQMIDYEVVSYSKEKHETFKIQFALTDSGLRWLLIYFNRFR